MVINVTSFSRSGLADWFMQRISALVLGIYFVVIGVFFILHPQLTYQQWHGFFAQYWVRILTLFSLFMLVVHAWIGLWTISTDYLTELALGKKALAFRLGFQLISFFALLAYLVWGVFILWGL